MEPRKTYVRKLTNLLKLILLFATSGFIFYKIFYAYHLEDLVTNIPPFDFGWQHSLLFVAAFVLMCFNWMIEASKWRLLINKNEQIAYWDAVKAVTCGVALSIITPNQIGDFAGRVIHLKKFSKIKGTLVTIIGHTAQMMMTAIFGFSAFIWVLEERGKITHEYASLLFKILLAAIIIALIAYLNIRFLSRIRLKKVADYVSVFALYTRAELLQVLVFAFLRYSIFMLQYFILLRFFNVSIGSDAAIACIMATLCAQSFVPSFILIELGMRGASALWFFGMYTDNVSGVLLSAYTLWIVNLMLPGLIGLGVIMRWRFVK